MTVRKWIIVVCTLFFSLPALAAETSTATPVRQLNSALLQAMRGGSKLGLEGRYRLLAPVVDEAFALPLMARTAAGRFWRQLTAEQQKRYLQKYRQWTITTYASNFDRYSGQKFTTHPPKNLPPTADMADVASTFTDADGHQTLFDYRVVRTGSGWQIGDVRVEGVSQLALTRTQFGEILSQKGLKGLLAMLDKKIAAMKGNSPQRSGHGQ